MNKQVSQCEFRSRSLALMREVEETGRPLIITDRGQPVVEVRSLRKPEREPLEELEGSVLFYERPFDPAGVEDWEALAEPDRP